MIRRMQLWTQLELLHYSGGERHNTRVSNLFKKKSLAFQKTISALNILQHKMALIDWLAGQVFVTA